MSNDRSTNHGEPRLRSCRAFAHVRGTEIAFRQSGRGQPVVLVGPDSALRREIEARLAERYTVVVPDASALGAGSEDRPWLCEFIDCLGLHRTHLVATEPLGFGTVELALADADGIERIVVLNDEVANSDATKLAAGRLLALTLVAEPGTAAMRESLDRLSRFLESGATHESR